MANQIKTFTTYHPQIFSSEDGFLETFGTGYATQDLAQTRLDSMISVGREYRIVKRTIIEEYIPTTKKSKNITR